MHPNTNAARRRVQRSLSWPLIPESQEIHKTTSLPQPSLTVSPPQGEQSNGSAVVTTTTTTTTSHSSYEDDLHDDPQNHFLSPIQMYEYEYEYDSYDSDDDSDDGEVEWDAGITDFALFTNDRRAAEASHEPLPSKWSHLMAEQASALHRAVMRNRENSDPDPVRRQLVRDNDGVPGLTPDASPEIKGDDGWDGDREQAGNVPDYLAGSVTVAGSGDERSDDDDELLSPNFVSRKQKQAAARRGMECKAQRPGMQYSRTMSGQVHAWRRPSWGIYTLGEEVETEGEGDGEEGRGRDLGRT